MKGIVVALLLLASVAPIGAQAQEKPAGFEFIIGPRVGANYVATTPEAFSAALGAYFPVGSYFPLMSLFGLIAEQRILLGQTQSHFAFQEMLIVSGLEQGVAIPSGLVLIGYRDASGFEVGAGPRLATSGFGVAVAVGWTFNFSGAFVPVDLSVVLPSAKQPAAIALTTGFNFVISSSP